MPKKIWIGLLVSAVALYLALKDVQFGPLWETLSGVRYSYVLLGVASVIILIGVRTIRWQMLLHPIKPVRFRDLFAVYMIGLMANNILPARLGELVRIYLAGSRERISKSSSLATVVVERLFDMGSLFAILGIVSFHFRRLDFPAWVWSASLAAFIISASLLLVLLVMAFIPGRIISFLENRFGFLPLRTHRRVVRVAESFLDGLNILRRAHVLWQVAGLSAVIWGLQLIIFLWGFMAFQFHLPAAALFVLVLITSFAMAVPSSPAYIGTYQISIIIALAIFDVAREAALGYSLVVHALQALPITFLGLFYTWKDHLTVRQLSKVEMDGGNQAEGTGDNLVRSPGP